MEVAMKEAQSALTRAANDMALFYNAHCRGPTIHSQRKGLTEWTEHYDGMSDEEARPQMAQLVCSGQGYLTKHL